MSILKQQTESKFLPSSRVIEEVKRSKGTIFGVSFIKMSGQLRRMACRISVKKGVKGTSKRDTLAEDKAHDYIRVFDINAMGFRRINLKTVIETKVRGIKTTAY